MTLMKRSQNYYPTFPSFFDKFFEGNLMDWNNWNFSSTDTTLPAVNIKEDKDSFMIEVAAPGMKKEDFKIDYDNGRLTISSEHKNESSEKNERWPSFTDVIMTCMTWIICQYDSEVGVGASSNHTSPRDFDF